jgi:hypothetical protein
MPAMERRAFLVGGMVGSVFVACRSWTRPTKSTEVANVHELATIAAIADAFIPGGDGTPGAIDCDAVRVIVDPANGVNPYVSEVVSDLDDWCGSAHGGKKFVELDTAEREVALEERMGLTAVPASLYLAAYEGMLALTKLAFFGGIANKLGTNWVGFPGASTGYHARGAAGAYASADGRKAIAKGASSSIVVAGEGKATEVRVSVLATSDDDVKATLRVIAPDGKAHELSLDAEGGDALIDDVAVPLVGGWAAGTWKLEVAAIGGGSGTLELWSLRLRTDVDASVSVALGELL